MPNYYFTLPDSVTLPTDGNKVSLTTDCELHRDDSALPNALTVAAGAYNVFLADTPGTGTATAPDVTAPVLSSPTGAANGSTGATSLGVTTDEGNGTLYWGIYPTASTPTAADVVAGTGATVNGSQAVSSTGAQSVTDQTGLTASTAYKAHYVHDDAASNRSNLSTSSEFTTAAASNAPSAVGGGSGNVVYSTSQTIPLHASAADGDLAIVVVAYAGATSTTIALTGSTEIMPVTTVGDSFAYILTVPIDSTMVSAGEIAFTIGSARDCTSAALVVRDGAYAAASLSAGSVTTSSSPSCPTITVGADSMTVGILISDRQNYTSAMTPTATYIANPTNKTTACTIGFAVHEGESAGSSSSISGTTTGSYNTLPVTLEIEVV